MIKQHVDVLFMDGELMLGDTLRLYKGDNGILISVKVEKQYYKNNKLITENLIELGKYGRAIIRKGQHDCPIHNEESEDPAYCSEVAKIENGRLDILIPKEAIDETSEMGIYEIQIQLYGSLNEGERPRLTLDPFEFEACDLISEDLELEEPIFDDEGAVVDVSQVDTATLTIADEEIPIKKEDGSFNKVDWNKGDIITAAKLDKIEETLDILYGIRPYNLQGGNLNQYLARIVNNLEQAPKLGQEIHIMLSNNVFVELEDGMLVPVNQDSERNTAKFEVTLSPSGFIKRCKLKLTLATERELIICAFVMNMGDEKAVLVDNSLNRLESVDLASLATQEYVLSAIEEIPEVDLSGYATKEEFNSLNENVGSIETQLYDKVTINEVQGELAAYATKEELQNQLGSIDAILDAINGEVL